MAAAPPARTSSHRSGPGRSALTSSSARETSTSCPRPGTRSPTDCGRSAADGPCSSSPAPSLTNGVKDGAGEPTVLIDPMPKEQILYFGKYQGETPYVAEPASQDVSETTTLHNGDYRRYVEVLGTGHPSAGELSGRLAVSHRLDDSFQPGVRAFLATKANAADGCDANSATTDPRSSLRRFPDTSGVDRCARSVRSCVRLVVRRSEEAIGGQLAVGRASVFVLDTGGQQGPTRQKHLPLICSANVVCISYSSPSTSYATL